jgi:hypothetical protein
MPNMTRTDRLFPSGTQIGGSGINPVVAGKQDTQTANKCYTDPVDPSVSDCFLFWNVDGSLYTTPTISFVVPEEDFNATAWYIQEVGGPAASVQTYLFSLVQDKELSATPISSVSPPGAWPGPPATSVATDSSNTPVSITAIQFIPGAAAFSSWLVGSGSLTPTGRVLKDAAVGVEGGGWAVAFYGPDPCDGIRQALDNLDPGDFPSPAAYARARQFLEGQLIGCLRLHGELP